MSIFQFLTYFGNSRACMWNQEPIYFVKSDGNGKFKTDLILLLIFSPLFP